MALRIHILGASGAGTSTLARNLANRLGTQAFDSDDFYWVPTEPPFVEARPPDERVALMQAVFLPRSDWILAGQFLSWGREIVPRLTHVIFLTVETELRLARLADREKRRYGDQIAPGGPRERHFQDFMDWAAAYDDPCFTGRSRVQQEAWLARLEVPVIRLDASLSPFALTEAAMAALPREGWPDTGPETG